ncbi:SRPBCC family protein [Nonomuraea maheshkhaliensis]|uniref:SRPBCC family protein n=1 Tax=Nonomuraea maheshkhaliensis TaxID=419590 RepID=A0ABP4RGB8_9ACTN
MATATATTDLPASPDQVWRLIGGFGSLPDWLPFIPTSELEEGGRVRHLTTADGATIVERLERFDDRSRSYTYAIVQAPFPVTDYHSTIAVHPGVDADHARVEWSGTFTPRGATDEETVKLFHGIYADGLAALAHALRT